MKFSRWYDCIWLERPQNVIVAPGEVYVAAVKLRAKEVVDGARSVAGLPPAELCGEMRSPVTVEWMLEQDESELEPLSPLVPVRAAVREFRSPASPAVPAFESCAPNGPVAGDGPLLASLLVVSWSVPERSAQELLVAMRG
jgi:hypothetical protein